MEQKDQSANEVSAESSKYCRAFYQPNQCSIATTIMNDGNGSRSDPANFAQRGTPLSISTSRPQADGCSGQLPDARRLAQPPSQQRTLSEPLPLASSSKVETPTRAYTYDPPRSASYADRSLRFAGGEMSPSTGSYGGDKMKRRHSSEPKINGYTACGRHSNDWLFGGFSVSGQVKKLWEKDKKA